MKAEIGSRIRIVKKNDDYSQDYQVGDEFTVEGTWYGGVHVTSPSGVPLSLDEEEFEAADQREERKIDRYSYELGVMDCFCEMVAAGLKTLAMSHPCDTKEERDSYEEDVRRICDSYGIQYYPEDEPFLTDLFPEELNKDKFNYLFFRDPETLGRYMALKREKVHMIKEGIYQGENRRHIAAQFGRLLSYPEERICRYIEKTTGRN
ncbi:MAG TPA: hypothetical protein IAA28_00245 [Candidatus Lachnoclostridium stercoripullorum]|uniref:Uncharacterized protein n=1 Tax=Candidatus Lachnoclostridium stercoripullorum TaxID=2838635 RepID=A0A9D2AVB0_9FIRM|nr:hypothetical protein [Candidatus Lachnoclostridium stercoripullorum]